MWGWFWFPSFLLWRIFFGLVLHFVWYSKLNGVNLRRSQCFIVKYLLLRLFSENFLLLFSPSYALSIQVTYLWIKQFRVDFMLEGVKLSKQNSLILIFNSFVLLKKIFLYLFQFCRILLLHRIFTFQLWIPTAANFLQQKSRRLNFTTILLSELRLLLRVRSIWVFYGRLVSEAWIKRLVCIWVGFWVQTIIYYLNVLCLLRILRWRHNNTIQMFCWNGILDSSGTAWCCLIKNKSLILVHKNKFFLLLRALFLFIKFYRKFVSLFKFIRSSGAYYNPFMRTGSKLGK